MVLPRVSGDTIRIKISILLSAFFLLSSATNSFADAPPGFECKDGTCSRRIGFSSPTFELGDPFKAETKSAGEVAGCPDGTCSQRSQAKVDIPKGGETTGCQSGTCGKPSSFASAPPAPGAAAKSGPPSAAKGGCSFKGNSAKANVGNAAKAAGGACKSGGKKGLGLLSKIVKFLTFGLLG